MSDASPSRLLESGAVAMTVDTEWARKDVLGDVLDLLARYGVRATLFVTDPAADCRDHDVAIHMDGTSRVQTVSAKTNPRYYALIQRFARS